MKSNQASGQVCCPQYGTLMYVYDKGKMTLKDIPSYPQIMQSILAEYHRYRCPYCRETLTENIGFKYPGIRITTRAASWIMYLLRQHSAIKDIHEITCVHWDTIH